MKAFMIETMRTRESRIIFVDNPFLKEGLSLRVFAEKDIQPVGKGEFLVPVISEILKRQIFYLHNPRKTRRKYFLFL